MTKKITSAQEWANEMLYEEVEYTGVIAAVQRETAKAVREACAEACSEMESEMYSDASKWRGDKMENASRASRHMANACLILKERIRALDLTALGVPDGDGND